MNHKLFVSLRQLVLITVMVGFSGLSLWAMPASPAGFVEQQPDGSEVHLHLEGDEFFHWLEDVKGYTVLKDRDWFVYGRKDETGRLVPTGLRVGTNNPAKAGLLPRELPDPAFRNLGLDRPQQADGSASNSSPSTAVVQGTYPNLVVLLRFSDHASRAVPSTGDIDILMNAPGGHPTLAPTGSVRDIYLENSYGQLALNSSVAYWVTLPDTEAYYANGNSGLTTRTHEALRFALNTLDADPTFDFTNFDSDSVPLHFSTLATLQSSAGPPPTEPITPTACGLTNGASAVAGPHRTAWGWAPTTSAPQSGGHPAPTSVASV